MLVLLRYGGARTYRAAQPAVIGLIVGEVFASVFWRLVPAVLAILGRPYIVVPIQPM